MLCDSCHIRDGVCEIVEMIGDEKVTRHLCDQCFEASRYSTPDRKQLREYRMLFELVPDGDHANPPDGGEPGLRSKLGGKPDWMYSSSADVKVECESCKRPMTFVAQIDSIEHQGLDENPHGRPPGDDQHYMFSDVGMLYVFLVLPLSFGRGAS
jgi:protein-arginine kinase activator protein McsA